MLTTVDGPCKGTFMVTRAPVFLRVVKKTELDGSGHLDVLDQPEDKPDDDEFVFVYERFGPTGTVHIDGTGIHGAFVIASYRLMPAVDGQALRDNNIWQAWARQQLEARKKAQSKEASGGETN